MSSHALPSGDVVIGGRFFGTMSIGSSGPISQSAGNNFVAKLRGSDGALLWIQQFSGAQNLVVNFVDADAQGDVYVSGIFINTVSLNGTNFTSAGSTDVFAAKLSGTSGNYIWAHAFGAASQDLVAALAVDRMGNVSLTGTFSGTITPGQSALTGTNATYIVKYNGTTGIAMWTRSINSSDTASGDFPTALATDSTGNVIVCGSFLGTVNFGGQPITASANGTNFVVKYSSGSGSYVFDRESPNNAQLLSAGADASDNIYVTGSFTGSLSLSASPLTSAGDSDVFVVRYSPTGTAQWSKAFGNTLSDRASKVSIDTAGELLLSTTFQGTVSYGGPSYVSAGSSDVLVTRLRSQDGGYLGSIQVGGIGGEHASAVGTIGGNVLITGDFTGSATFDGSVLTSPTSSSSDGFAMLVLSLNL